MKQTITHLVGTMYDYLNNPPKINYIVVDYAQDAFEEEKVGEGISKLRKDEAVSEVRHALNVWHYS